MNDELKKLREDVDWLLDFVHSIELHKPADCRYCLIECGYWKRQVLMKALKDTDPIPAPESCPWRLLVLGDKKIKEGFDPSSEG